MWRELSIEQRRAAAIGAMFRLQAKSLFDALWLGGVTFGLLTIATISGFGVTDLASWILLLAMFVLCPMALRLQQRGDAEDRLLKMAIRFQPVAAVAAVAAILQPAGTWAALAAVPWFALTLLLAGRGGWQLCRGAWRSPARLASALGLLLVPIGGAWFVMWRYGAWPGGFSERIAQLTAVHFHYAGFLLLQIAAQIFASCRRRSSRAAAGMLALAIVFFTLLLAVGITASPGIEIFSAWALAISVTILGGWQLRRAWVSLNVGGSVSGSMRVSASCWVLSTIFLWCGLGLAATFAYGEYVGTPLLTIEQMIPLHGLAMSVGFTLLSLTGWILFHHGGTETKAENQAVVESPS